MQPVVAYLAGGKLFLRRPDRTPDEIESPFAQEVIDHLVRSREKNEWKSRSQTGRIMSGRAVWAGADEVDLTARRIQFSGLARGQETGTLLYALDTDAVGGLFVYYPEEKREQRLFHRTGFRARNLALHPSGQRVALSLQEEDGTASIALMHLDGKGLQTITEGDSIDEAPAWVAGSDSKLVFQSAGLGRDQAGHLAGMGPYAVQLLDLEREDLSTLAEDPRRDFLLPRMAADGALYYIRRPYQPVRAPGLGAILKDALLLPVRLVWAVFGFLNFFSLMFSGNPLTTAGGPKREGPSPRQLLLWGKLVDAEKAERRARKGEPAALVPKEWQLVRRAPDGTEEVLAESVLSFDLDGSGGVVFTNGSAVYHRGADGPKQQLCSGKLIEHVILAE